MSQTKAQLIGAVGILTATDVFVNSTVRITSSGIDATTGIVTSSELNTNFVSVTGSINATGIITASNKFDGNLTGIVTGNVTGNLTGNVSGEINSSGISTIGSLKVINSIYNGISSTSSNPTLSNREYIVVVSSGASISLPASPQAGWEVGISVGNFEDVHVLRNGSKIMGLNEDLKMDLKYLSLRFLYVDANQGWRAF